MAALSKEARTERARYMREWRKRNPEKQREYDAKKWENVAQRRKAEQEAVQA